MAVEIERKFLLKDETWREGAEGRYLCQAYLNVSPGCTVRVRIDGDSAFLTLKGRNRGPGRLEFEYAVPLDDAKSMLAAFPVSPLVEKTRYTVPFGGFVWEVDEFHGANRGLVLAEIELEAVDQAFPLPAWAGREVTGEPRYYNSSLAGRPYSVWDDDEK